MIRPIKLRAKTTDGEWATGDLCFNGVEPPQILWVRDDSVVTIFTTTMTTTTKSLKRNGMPF